MAKQLGYQKKLLKEPKDFQIVITRFLVSAINASKLVNYEHVVLGGAVHAIKKKSARATVMEYEFKDAKIKKLSLDFNDGFLLIPLGFFQSLRIILFSIREEQEYSEILPISLVLNYGVFDKESGIIMTNTVATIILRLINVPKRIMAMANKISKTFSEISIEQNVELTPEEAGKEEFENEI